jgi:ferredoxin
MIGRAASSGIPWRLVYLGRTEAATPYLDDLRAHGDRVVFWPSGTAGRFDLAALFGTVAAGTAVYACGPELLLAAVEELGCAHGVAVHVERFAPRPQEHGADGDFQVVLAESGRTVTVAAGESVLDAVNRAGATVLSTCREGTCGTCEVRVLAGTPDHRDSVLSAAERRANRSMMTCVSRSATPSLTLDL